MSEKQVKDYLKEHTQPTDEEFHKWAKSRGLNPHMAEEEAYKLASKQARLETGGMSGGKKPKNIDQKQLRMGIRVELEHTKDKDIAKKIALDHLEEIPDYYTRLNKMENEVKKSCLVLYLFKGMAMNPTFGHANLVQRKINVMRAGKQLDTDIRRQTETRKGFFPFLKSLVKRKGHISTRHGKKVWIRESKPFEVVGEKHIRDNDKIHVKLNHKDYDAILLSKQLDQSTLNNIREKAKKIAAKESESFKKKAEKDYPLRSVPKTGSPQIQKQIEARLKKEVESDRQSAYNQLMKQNIIKNYETLVREHFENLPDRKKVVSGKVLNVAQDQPHIYTQVGDRKIMVEHSHVVHHVAPKEKEAPRGQLVVPPEDPEERKIFNQRMSEHRYWNDDKAQYQKQLKEEQNRKNQFYRDLAESKKDEPTKLIEKHLDYGSKLASDFYRRTYHAFKGFVEYDDIQSSAFLGLVVAAQNFDPGKKVEFSTYAHPFVMNELRNIKNYFQNSAKISEFLIRRITRLENDIEKTTFITAEKLKEIKSYAGEMSVSLSKQFSKNPDVVERERKRIAKDIETAMVDEYYEKEKKRLGELPSATHLESAEAEQKIEAKSEMRNRRVNALLGSIISEDYDSVMKQMSKLMSVKERLAIKLRIWGWDYGEIGKFIKEYHAGGGQVPEIMGKITPRIKGAAVEKITSIPSNYFFKHEMKAAPDPDVMKKVHALSPDMKKVYEARYDNDGKPRTGGIRGVADRLGVTYHVAKRRLSELEKHSAGDTETGFINTAKDHIIGQNFVTSARKKIEDNRESMSHLVRKSYLFLGTKKRGPDEKIHLTLRV